jgi:predicted AAA+ superfamily ATPase
MTDHTDVLQRIANALERIAPPAHAATDWRAHPAYVWHGATTQAVPVLQATPLDLIKGVDAQKAAVVGNVERLAAGAAAHDMLLWGARGMGKSALLRAAVAAAAAKHPGRIALVQATADEGLATLFGVLRAQRRSFLVFIDDLGFDSGDSEGPRKLRSWLEGGVEARPANVRLAVTSNRRAIVERHMREQDDPINPRDVVDDQLALADRFGLSLGFHACSQDDYLAIIAGYAVHHALEFDPADALEWSKRRGARSGRVAWHYVTELAGRAGRIL